MNENEKTVSRKGDKKRDSGIQKMAVDVAFKVLKIVVDREASNRNGVPQMRIARKEHMVTSRYFNSKTGRTSWQFICTLKFTRSKYHES